MSNEIVRFNLFELPNGVDAKENKCFASHLIILKHDVQGGIDRNLRSPQSTVGKAAR